MKPRLQKINFAAALLAVGVLASLTAWLRLRGLGYSEMWGDQSQEIAGALAWLNGGAWPLAAMKSSFGVFNPPLVRYAYALPLALTRDLLGVVWLTALLNLAGLVAASLALGRVFGWRVAGWTAVLCLVNPWAIYYARLIWMQTLVPGFAGVCFACTLLAFAERPRPVYILVGALALAATIQVHLSSVVLIGVILALALILRPRWPLGALAAGAALAALTFLPYLLFQIQTGWVDLSSLREGLGLPSQFNAASGLIVLDLLQSKGIYATAGRLAEAWRASDLAAPAADALTAVLLVLAVLAALVVAGQAARQNAQASPAVRGRWVLLTWLLLPILAFLRHNHYLQNYYFLYEFPAPQALIVLLTEDAYTWIKARWASSSRSAWRGWAASAVFLPLGFIGAQQAWTSAAGLGYLLQGQVGQERVLDVRQAIAATRRLLAERPGCELVVVADGATAEASRFGLLREFLSPRPVRFMPAGSGYLVPAACALYFAPTTDAGSLAWLTANTRPLPGEALHTPEQTWAFFDLPAPARADLADRWQAGGPPLGEWENGLQLVRADYTGPSGPAPATVTLITTWRVVNDAARPVTHFGNYLLSAADVLVAQADGEGLASQDWRTGDMFQVVFTLALPADLPPGDYRLAVAQYQYPEIQRIPLASAPGDLLYVAQAALP